MKKLDLENIKKVSGGVECECYCDVASGAGVVKSFGWVSSLDLCHQRCTRNNFKINDCVVRGGVRADSLAYSLLEKTCSIS